MLKLTPKDLADVTVTHENDSCGNGNDYRISDLEPLMQSETVGGVYMLFVDFDGNMSYVALVSGGSGLTVMDTLTGGTIAAQEHVGFDLIRDYVIDELLLEQLPDH